MAPPVNSSEFITNERENILSLLKAAHRGDITTLDQKLSELSTTYGQSKGDTLIRSRDGQDDTALHKASYLGLVEVIQYLLSDEVFRDAPGTKAIFVELRNKDRKTAVHIAVEEGHQDYLEALHQRNANLETPNRFGWTALVVAVNAYIEESIEAATDRAISQSPYLQTPNANPPRHNPWRAIVDYLIHAGVNLNAQNVIRDTALHHAARQKNLQMVRLLLRSGAAPDLRNHAGHTPLHVAVLRPGSLECAQELLYYDVNPNNQENNLGYSILHSAVRDDNVNMIELLLDNGADEKLRNRAHLTSFELAQLYGEEAKAFFINRMIDQSWNS